MKSVSSLYTESMKNTVRNHSYMMVNLGILNQQAQSLCYVANQGDGFYLSSNKIFGSAKRKYYYATCEQDFTRANGEMLFAPTSKIDNITNGFITDKLLSEGEQYLMVEFNEVTSFNLKGLTITFGDYFPPIDFDIETGSEVLHVTGNTNKVWSTTEVFDDVQYIKIKTVTMKNENLRLRVENIYFGVGIMFDNDTIISSTQKSFNSVISESLPQIDFSVTVKNSDNEYNPTNEDSTINFLEIGQDIDVHYGYELNDGSVEWFKSSTIKLKSWSSDNKTAKFQAIDILGLNDTIYERGIYDPDGMSLYDLAVDVFETMGLTSDDYILDGYLENIYTCNPIPKVKCKEALQLIANCGRCTLLINDESKIIMQSNFIPDVVTSSTSAHSSSDPSNVGKQMIIDHYAFCDENVFRADGQPLFGTPTVQGNSGYVSNLVSGEDGYFSTAPTITVSLEANYSCVGFKVSFWGALPKYFVVHAYNDDEEIYTFTVGSEQIKELTSVNHVLVNFDKLVLEFPQMERENVRLRVDGFSFGGETNYILETRDMKKSPITKQLERVKEIVVNITRFEALENEEITTDFSGIMSATNNTTKITFNEEVFGHTFECKYQVTIIQRSCYYIIARVDGLPSTDTEVTFKVYSYKYSRSQTSISKQINNTGSTKVWDNVLVDNLVQARNMLDWLGDYFYEDVEYDFDFRGDPSLETNDIVMYDDGRVISSCKIYELTTSYNGALSGKIKARRRKNV